MKNICIITVKWKGNNKISFNYIYLNILVKSYLRYLVNIAFSLEIQ